MHQQRGMTLIGMLFTMTLVIFMGIVVMRMVPVYIHHYEVINSINTLNTLPSTDFSSDPSADAEMLRNKLLNQLYINSIESITPEQIKILPTNPGEFQISIKYQVIKPLVWNVSLLFNFETSQKVKTSAV